MKDGVWRSRRSYAYGLALFAPLVVGLVRFCLIGLLGNEAPFIIFGLAVAATASYGGFGPGLCATLLSGLIANFLFIEPFYRISVPRFTDQVNLFIFGSTGIAISLIGDRMVRALDGSQKDREALAASEKRFRGTFENVAVGIAHIATDGRWLRVNQKLCEIVGHSREELLEKTFQDITHPDDLKADLDRFAPLMRGEITGYSLEKRYFRKDGSLVWVNLTTSLERDAQGRPLYCISVVEDISSRKQAEEALRLATQKTEESLAELEAILVSMTECLILSDPAGNVLSMNPAGLAMHDLDDPRGVHRHLRDLGELFEVSTLDGQSLPPEEWMLGRALAGETFSALEVRIRNKRTDREWIASVGGTPIYNKQGELILALITIRDITNQKRIEIEREMLLASERAARSEAERANRMKDEFVATVSHELRTPLNAILGWVHMLMRPGRAEGDFEKGLAVIERNTRLQTQLINDLLDVSRISSGKLHMEMQTVEPEAILQAALDVQRPTAEAKGIRLCQDIDSKGQRVLGDPGRLQQVVWNLVSNAIKFTPKGGEVKVSLRRRGGKLELEVKDTGQGIEPEFVPHIFERFRQADSSMARKHGGLGLGLSIVKHIVEMHGGEVRAESEGLGKGAAFVVELPLEPLTRERSERERVTIDAGNDLSGLCVLVVDDEPDARELLERVLEEHEAEVVTAGSADEALSALEEQRFDMMVSDIGMPGMDGYALMREVRARALQRGDTCPPAIAVTAFARPEDRERALSAGYRLHLAKPIEPAELVASVAELSRSDARKPPAVRSEPHAS